jgi:hypothetical protein
MSSPLQRNRRCASVLIAATLAAGSIVLLTPSAHAAEDPNHASTTFTVDTGASAMVDASIDQETVVAGVSNHFTGTASKNAAIRVLNASGTVIVATPITADASGAFAIDRDVSKGATKLDFVIEQTVAGTTTKSRLFSLAAVAPTVTIDQKTVVAGVSNHFTGTAAAGAAIRVLNPSGTVIVAAPITADGSGAFAFDRVVSKGAAKLDFVIEQTVAGTVTESGVFSLAATTFAPATIDQTSVTAGVANALSGTATPGAAVRIVNASGTDIVNKPITVDTTGVFRFERVVSKGAANLSFKVEQTKDGKTSLSGLFVLRAV